MLKLLPKSSKMLSKNWIATIIATFFLMEWNHLEKNVEYVPKSLRIFLDNLFVGKEKSVPLVSIGKAIMQQV